MRSVRSEIPLGLSPVFRPFASPNLGCRWCACAGRFVDGCGRGSTNWSEATVRSTLETVRASYGAPALGGGYSIGEDVRKFAALEWMRRGRSPDRKPCWTQRKVPSTPWQPLNHLPASTTTTNATTTTNSTTTTTSAPVSGAVQSVPFTSAAAATQLSTSTIPPITTTTSPPGSINSRNPCNAG
jgi:hypothetical protein